jgi:hypothetical protein
VWWVLWLSAVIAAAAAYAYMPTLWRLHEANAKVANLKEDNERLRSQVEQLQSKAAYLKSVTDGAVAITAFMAASQGGQIEIPRTVREKDWILTRRDDRETGTMVFVVTEDRRNER